MTADQKGHRIVVAMSRGLARQTADLRARLARLAAEKPALLAALQPPAIRAHLLDLAEGEGCAPAIVHRLPRPQVTCGGCLHFLPDSINPEGGAGTCGLGLPYRRGETARWPLASRQCGDFRPD